MYLKLLNILFIFGLMSSVIAEDKFMAWVSEVIAPIQASSWSDETPIMQQTPHGILKGMKHQDIRIFRGISYAKAPINELRFAPPVKVESWKGVKDATHFGPMCYQEGDGNFSEDCLSLNLWVPEHTQKEKLPVYVFIHGGGYTLGSGSQPLYEGTELAKAGIIVVTINYRLNTLGFFPSQTTYETYGTTGNWALLDMIMALEWVRDNVASFGGDPKRVTIGGESAGSYSVSALISSPKAKGLFQQAIMESGALTMLKAVAPKTAVSYEQAAALSAGFFHHFGLEDTQSGLSQLRQIPVKEIVSTTLPIEKEITSPQVKTFWPILDGSVLPKNPLEELQKGNLNRVKLLFGFNSDEASIFINPQSTPDDYTKLVASMFGTNTPTILNRYPITAEHNAAKRMNELATLALLRSGMYLYADALSKLGEDVFAYHFDFVDPDLRETGFGVAHASELKYIFHNYMQSIDKDQHAQLVADQMYTAWTNFIKTGNPNGGRMLQGHVKWGKYSDKNRVELRLSEKSNMQPISNAEDVDFINTMMHNTQK